MSRPGVIFDLVAAQSPSYRGRGIARYSADLVRAMVEHHPELVSAVVVHPELPPAEDIDDLADWLTTEPDWAEGSVIHLSSVIEPEVPVRLFWPRQVAANRLLTVVTLYDLIPDVFPEWYLQDPGLRRRWRCCREVVRVADSVLTMSESARADAVRMLGVPQERVHVIGSGFADYFRPPESRPAALEHALRGVEGLEEGFIIYVGAFNPRKNVDGLVTAYAALPQNLIDSHQLLVVCHAHPLERNHYLVMAREMGLAGRILVSGYVPEDLKVSLYQSAALAVFPSLYEGYGLPVVESLACGTPTIAGDNSALAERLPPFALFDAGDPAAISEAMARALSEEAFHHRLLALTTRPPPSWAAVADRTAEVFEELLSRSRRFRPGWRALPHLALVGVPAALLEATRGRATHDRFQSPLGRTATTATDMADGGRSLAFASLSKLDPWRGGYDAVVAWVEDSSPATLEVMEQLAGNWASRAVALVDHNGVATDGDLVLALEETGVTVLKVGDGTSWSEVAGQLTTVAGGQRR